MADDNNNNGGRKFFRIPVEDSSTVNININGVEYKVINVAPGGVGISLDTQDGFSQGESVTNIVLTINTSSCKATGCIAHISPENDTYLCGIQFLDMDTKTRDLLKGFIDNHRASLFSFMPD